MTKDNTKKLLEKMVLAPPGTDITQEVRLIGERITERERNLQEKFYERSKSGKVLSDRQLSKMQEDVAKKWISDYKRKDKLTKDDLVFVPAFTLYGENDLAREVVQGVMSSDKYDNKRGILYHGRTYKYGDLGDNFVGLSDQICLVKALVSVGDKKKARKVMDATRDLLVEIEYNSPDSEDPEIQKKYHEKMQEAIDLVQEKGIKIIERDNYGLLSKLTINQFDEDDKLDSLIKELRKMGFNVGYRSLNDIAARLDDMQKPMCLLPKGSILTIKCTDCSKISDFSVLPYVNADTGKLCEADDHLYRENQTDEIVQYLNGELSLGNKDLVSKIMESVSEEDYGTYAIIPTNLISATSYLMLWRHLERKDKLKLIEESEKEISGCFIPELGLYRKYQPSFKSNAPEMNRLGAESQLSMALLHIYDGNLDEAKRLITATKNAGLYKRGKFIDRDCCGVEEIHECTNALGMIVLEGLKNPESLRTNFNL